MANTNNNKSLNVPILRFPGFTGEWERSSLGEVTIFVKERIGADKLTRNNYVSTENMNPDFGGINQASSVPNNTNVIHYQKGDVLLSNIRPYLRKVWAASSDGGCSADVFVFRAKSISSSFLHYIMANDTFINYVMSGAKGVKMPRGDKEQILKYIFSTPNIEEQNKISHLLHLLDERISTQNKIIEDLKKLKSAFLKKLLQGKEWNKYYIRNLAEVKGGGTPSSSNTSFWSGNIPWVSSSDVSEENIYDVSITRYITDEAIDNSATKICEAPCVLIVSRVGVGKVALSNMPLCTSQDFCNLVKIKCNPMFLAYQLSLIMKRKAKEVQGTSIKGITIDEIQKIEVFLPNKKEQNQIASKLSNVDNLISVETKFLQCYQKQRTYLLQQLFI